MRTAFRALVMVVLVALSNFGLATEILPKGYVFFHADYGGQQLVVDTGTMVRFALPVEQMRGYTVRVACPVKAENVSKPPHPWNGVKLMLAIETPSSNLWPSAEFAYGSFEFKNAAFVAKIPSDATKVTLCLGVEEATGKVTFGDAIVTVARMPEMAATEVCSNPAKLYTGHAEPQLRGAMVSPNIDAESLRLLGLGWKANLIRWQLVRHETKGDYDAWLDKELKRLDAALPVCQEAGLRVVLDLHSPPGGKMISGGYAGANDRLFTEKACQDKLVEVWLRLAKRYKGCKTIWGYDLVNEPDMHMLGDDCDDWHDLAERAAKAIREIDPDRAIIVEPDLGGGPDGLLDFAPIAVSNVVYSVHMYAPAEFTHQGVYHPMGVDYPGVIAGKQWDKAQMEAALQPVVEFQKKYGVHIYIGEFSAARWAPNNSAYRYLRDVIDIFESNGWDWSYHAFREWDGWSVEHGPDPKDHQPATTPTDRQRLLCDWFAKNAKSQN